MLPMRFFWSLFVWITGWKIQKNFPYHLDKCVLIVAPHTSAWDFIVGLAIRSVRHLEHVKYLGKDSLFKGPFAFIFKSTNRERKSWELLVDFAEDILRSCSPRSDTMNSLLKLLFGGVKKNCWRDGARRY